MVEIVSRCYSTFESDKRGADYACSDLNCTADYSLPLFCYTDVCAQRAVKELPCMSFYFWIELFFILSVIFLEHKNPHEAIMWVLVISALPYFGVFAYLIFGNTINIKISRLLRSRRFKKRSQVYNEFHRLMQGDISDTDKSVALFNYNYNHAIPTTHDSVSFFTSGEAHYKALFEDIERAKSSIHVEFYTIHEDEVGKAFVKLLSEKAKEGVTVTVICDFLANIHTSHKMFAPIVKNGGYVKRIKRSLTHFRSHRKIVTVDGEIAYIGGMNIGKQYANRAKVKNPWRDTQVRLTGACVAVLENHVNMDTICTMNDKEDKRFRDACSIVPIPNTGDFSNMCQFMVGGIDDDKESIKMCYLSMIRSAKSKICIQSPYFVPDDSLLDALKVAAASGVQIEIMLPLIKSSFFLEPVSDFYANELVQYGAKIFKYKGYIHAKTMLIDQEICCVGSVNIDVRSLKVDDEICGVFYNNTLVEEYAQIFREDIENCICFDSEKFAHRSKAQKIKERFFLLFAPLM